MRGIRRSAREQAAVTVATAPPVSPELALVCPDLHEQALALLPTVDPDALFRRVPRPVAPVRAFVQDALIESFADPPDVPIPVAVAVYTASRALRFAVRRR